ncbi:L,D-transpeptidase family protein [Fundidesulfovibrio putealis]|uniref:L,D-transpeptidase family protein n=1 Tax=Fundidesulfovibrio putealis TaxID=270496 RepID=UPI002E2492EA|nr:L,D-transpeptidase family protein [Fundidesulfovibrio putealis]
MTLRLALILSAVAVLLLQSVCDAATHPDASSLFGSRQVLLVTSESWDATTGQLQLFERESLSSAWIPVGKSIPVSLGRTGMAWGIGLHAVPRNATLEKREGDGKAPAGIFSISTAFGYADNDSIRAFPYLKIASGLECVDDPLSSSYNRILDASAHPKDWNSSETMLRPDGLYAAGAVVEHNSDPVSTEKGSCIFLHIWRGPDKPTAGCTAMEEGALRSLLSRLDAGRKPLLVQLPRAEYQKLKKEWVLP